MIGITGAVYGNTGMSMRVISWEEFISPSLHSSFLISHPSLAVTIGVFDGVHRGHQSLICRICNTPDSQLPLPPSTLPTVVTFKQNPLQVLQPDAYTGDIMSLDKKLQFLSLLGVKLAVLIDFSEKFSKMNGRDFINLLLDKPVKMLALGHDFRCGRHLDTGLEEIRSLAGARGVEVWVTPPVMDGGQPVSSSRIRQALADGRVGEAERLLGVPPAMASLQK